MKHTFTRCIRVLLLIIVAVTVWLSGKAQYILSTLETGGSYTAVAKDASNNIYTTRLNSATNLYDVVKFTSGTGTGTVIYSGLSHGTAIQGDKPWGIAVNAFGDVYVLNSFETGTGQIIKLSAGLYTPTVVQSGRYFAAITVDIFNNLLAMEYNSSSAKFDIVRYTYGLEAYSGTRLFDGLSVPSAGTSYPWGLTTDTQGNIYFTDFMESPVQPAGGIIKLTYPSYAVSTLATGREFSALATDADNNLYTIEAVRKGVAAVVKYTDPTAMGVILDSSLTISGVTYPTGLTVNNNGVVYAADGFTSGNGRLIRLGMPTVVSVTKNGGSPTNATTVTFTVTFSTDVSTPGTNAFTLTTTGVTGAAIAGVSKVNNTTYNVVVYTGTDDGTIRLDVNGTGITPAMSNLPFTTGDVMIIDKTAPVISLAINGGAAVTNSLNVTLSETATDANAGLQMRFSADSSNWSAYETFAATKSYTLATGDGNQKVYMQVKDAAGNVSGTSAAINLDQTAPVVTIVTGPPNPTNSNSSTFTFTANEDVTGFSASIDGSPFLPATSPYTINGLSDGPHSVSVRATDVAGNLGQAATYSWTIDHTAPTIQSAQFSADATYHIGQVITLALNMSEVVNTDNAGDVPYVNLTIGSATVKAVYASGAGTNKWTFNYTVQEGDLDNDGIEAVSPLQVNGNSLTDAAGNVLNTTFIIPATTGVKVNGIRPTVVLTTLAPALVNGTFTVTANFSEAVTGLTATDITVVNGIAIALSTIDNITYTFTITPSADGNVTVSLPSDVAVNIGSNGNKVSNTLTLLADITAPIVNNVITPADGYYKSGSILNFTATFSEVVNVTGMPHIAITMGSSTVYADYISGTGTDELTFSYTVVDGDQDLDGIGVGALSGGSIKDAAGNDAVLTLNAPSTADVLVNTIAPVITQVTAPADGYYTTGRLLLYQVRFSDAVNVRGTPHIAFTIGNSTVYADYLIGTGTTILSFTYLVKDGDQDLDGIATGVLSGGSIKDGFDNDAVLTFTAPSTTGVLVNTIPPVISQVSVPANGYYHAGQTLDFSVQFNFVVDVTGTPVLPVTIGGTTVNAAYTGGTGTNTLSFSYTVQDGENDLDGISLSALTGIIQDLYTNNADLTLHNAGSTAGVYVYTVHPTVTLSTTASLVKEAYTVTAVFSEAVTGLAAADFNVVNGTASALTTTDNITYTLTITPSSDGNVTVSLPVDAAVNKGDNGNTASNTLTTLADLTAPAVTNVTVPTNGYYKSGSILNFIVTFGETVNVTGTPHIAITMGSSTVYADYVSGTGTSELTFSYTVVNGDQDLDGIAIGVLNGGSIKDAAGNDGILTLNAPSTAGVLINTIAPVITQVSVPANGYYHATQTLDFSVQFSSVVNVTGSPVLPVTIGSATVSAAYTSGTGTNILSFTYTVQDGENDLDGISLSALTGTIQDVFTNNADLTLNNAGSTTGVYVYTVHPTVTLSATVTNVNAPFTATATFSEAVTGLTTAGFTVINGTASNLQTSDNITYTLTITPSADGNVTVTLPADVVMNKGSNGNTASNTISVLSDITAPVITTGQIFSIDEYSAAGTTVGTINAVETTGTLQNWTITSDPSGAFAINAATGVLSVKDEAALNANNNTTVTLTLTVSDGMNVSNATTVGVTVVYVPLPPTDISLDNQIIVENTPVGTLVGHLSGVTAEPDPVYTYTLVAGGADNAFFSISGNQLLTNAILDYAMRNTYNVSIRATLANGLYTERSFTIQVGQVNQAPTLDVIADQEVCDITTVQTVQTTGASAVEDGQTLSYTVSADQPFFTSLAINANGLIIYHLQPNISGTVNVTVTVKDNGGTVYGGVDTLVSTFAIKVNALPTVIITADQDTVISRGTAMNLTATGGVSYEWSNAGGVVDGQQTATLQIKPVENTVYTVTVTDNNGCINEGAVTITVVNEFKIDAINLLTPNGDGKNDKWIINDLSRYPNNDLTIYDRTGRVVYHQKNYSNEWNGTYNGSPLAEGTYYYILKADGYNTPAKGFITIIRDQH
ncbi:Ig-like domain-containing protein [Chitinophaga sp. LS1]|uniref:Ig-like domain-containing protein n=1 Tax=Chitinophaga sp. LS1 TaxID=3051176 RepID=UPI002AAA639C|nr:Ig-like domain-containing protein [Chitinophaga sp. LS1]WPV66730.1 Ig-like domain-containing protein [Chitinophaga sp. LS1]